jgi:hypothetical protein
MKLLTKELEKKMPALYAQDGKGQQAVAYVKFFHPMTSGVWFATEFDPNEKMFFGWAEIQPGCGELGYFSLTEMESVKVWGLGIERDLYFNPCTLDEAIKEYRETH